MRFSEIVKEAREWLRRDGRLRYRSLKREYDLNEEALEDLRDELMESQQVAIDQDGKMLVWTGDGATPPQSAPSQSQPQSPASYTRPNTWPTVSARNKRPWNPVAQPMASGKPSRPCLLISKAPLGTVKLWQGEQKIELEVGGSRSPRIAFSVRGGKHSLCTASNTPRIWHQVGE